MKKVNLLLVGFIVLICSVNAQTLVKWDFQNSGKQTACLTSLIYSADAQVNNATAEANFSNLKNWTNNKGESFLGFNGFDQLTGESTDGDYLVSTRGWTESGAFFQLSKLNTFGNSNVSLVFETYTQTNRNYRNWKVEYQIDGAQTWESFAGNTWNVVADDVIIDIPIEKVNHVVELPAILQNSASVFHLRILPVTDSPSIDPSKSNNNLAWTKFDNIELVNDYVTAVPSVNLDEIAVYPTVLIAGQSLNVEYSTSSKAVISFYTLAGQLSKEVVCNSQETIETADLKPGIYIYKVVLGEAEKTGKIVIQ